MLINVTLVIDEAAHGDSLYYPLVATLLRLHADDIERTGGATLVTNYDEHKAYSTRIDSPGILTAVEIMASPAFRALSMPKGPIPKVEIGG